MCIYSRVDGEVDVEVLDRSLITFKRDLAW